MIGILVAAVVSVNGESAMTENEQIWGQRASGMSISEIAKLHGIPEQDVRKILTEAPQKYVGKYNRAWCISDNDYKAFPPKKHHDKV